MEHTGGNALICMHDASPIADCKRHRVVCHHTAAVFICAAALGSAFVFFPP